MKTIFLIAAIVYSVAASSQITKVSLQASGLTCSMCSNAINKAIKSLDFVDKVDANIKTSTFEITFKPNSKVDFDKLKNKVEGAGFSVASFVAAVRFNNIQVKSNQNITVGDKAFQFVNSKDQFLNGIKQVKVINKGFVSSKEYKKNNIPTAQGKMYHVIIQS